MSVLKAALIGKNISHSISPRVHEEIFNVIASRSGSSFTSIDYTINDCDESCDFADWLKKASTNGIRGANITIPYKSDAYSLTDEHFGMAAAIESANTIAINHKTIAISTDGEGFLSALLREHPEFNLEKYHLICIGAGDTARAILYSLCTRWMPRTLTIVNRSLQHAEELANFCIAQAPGPTVRVMSIDDFMSDYAESRYRLIIQATPVGGVVQPGNLIEGFAWDELDFAIDLGYRPLQTSFLTDAVQAGAKTMNGLGMLIEQAAYAQQYWLTRILPERSPLSDAEYQSIKERLTKELS
jgi:shikimate dehydrogenase